MAENKKSFILYADMIATFEGLDDDEAGRLVKHLFRYVNDLSPVPPDKITAVAFIPIQNQLKRDLEKWDNELLKNSENGHLGNLKRYQPDLYEKVMSKELSLHDATVLAKGRKVSPPDTPPTGRDRPPIAKLADNDTVTDTVITNTNTEPTVLVGTADQYAKIPKDSTSINKFINTYKPKFHQPYTDLWNLFCDKFGTAKLKTVSESRKKKLKTRLSDKNFDFPKILKAASEQKFALEGQWFNFDFLIENDTNFIKVLENKYLKSDSKQPLAPAGLSSTLDFEN